jgi:diguanylate cyclase (GGDEF)-like protein/PAS domain S-box-containing protein
MLDAALLVLLSGGVVYVMMWFSFRKLARERRELEENERRFRGLTELSADWFWETDAEHRVVWISGGSPVATFFGATPLYGKRLWEVPGVEVDPRALEAHRERLARQLPFFDLEIARTDNRGARQIHIISGQVRRDAAGRVAGYRGVGRDVTEQRIAEEKLFQAKERLELALEGGGLAEVHIDLDQAVVFAGDGCARFLGYEGSPELTSMHELFALVHKDDQPGFREAFVAVLKGERPEFSREFRILHKQGTWRWLYARGRVMERDRPSGRARKMSGTLADIDARKRAEDAVRRTELRFDHVADLSREYMWETDAAWRYTYLSERVEAILGYSRAEMLGFTPREFMPLGELRDVEDWFGRHATQAVFRDLVHRTITKAGGVVWQSVSGVPIRDGSGAITGYRGTAADVTGRKQAEARIEFLATRDSLTGLPNRILLADRAGQAILAAARNRSQLALLCFDLDRFKLVNDSLDHRTGDALLRAVAERLENLLPDGTLARLGGDDFVLLRPVKSVEDAAQLAQRVLDVLARPFSVEGRTLTAGASIGISVYPGDGRDFTELLKNADSAMHHAKEAGRGTWRFYEPAMQARATERLRLENELRGALTRGELFLHWHPVVRGGLQRAGALGRVVGAEALVRWQHPERGLLMPEDFVPLAEQCGLIRAVGEWTLERALSQAGAWLRKHPGQAWFAVNVSAAELSQGEAFFQRIRQALQANGVSGSALELEVTERTLMSNLSDNIAALRRIGELGVQFAVDDFGTGYSSLAYLRLLPIHKLKIDRSFLREIDRQPADQAIVRAIAAMAETLGLSIAAEGVENVAQLEHLQALGCDVWQGHLFSAPVDAASFEAMLSAPAYSGPAPSAISRRGSGTLG